ncbi:D-alanyl-D-alanine carboxypeptidase/D-alanyl-D-alanine endopeptidase [Anianabacter salinae]|uniref:D-alanyl-D-alanine carboxypeptidase/D-alanyl-D-alanine endopeptidase n=1 Tax=Anianabacter salinae TaxID=2851023 RepID=UPI00225E09DF|nr:D-alanyl-D-alanine carboxypeptidase/D-alanyl-D-alanine-endopeptidase [Anianabacter salinae]MBV0911007.1 D-alanyl-D-alanine carboxypeptidase/D-alanyl-D-alanine-endopeptidase [Anianabacter salinae]
MALTRRIFLGSAAATAANAAWAGAPTLSSRPVARPADFHKRAVRSPEDLIAEAALSGKIGYVVADAASGEVLETHSPLVSLPPASTTKAISALYALDRLGAGYRFKTRLRALGEMKNGKLDGDLCLEGGGDPTLDTDALGDMAQQLKEAGLREITGRFVVHTDALPSIFSIDPGQPDHLGYSPAVSGLNLNYNRVHFQWAKEANGYTVSMDARASRFSPEVGIARMTVVDRDLPVYTYADQGGSDLWTVARPALGNGGSRWLPVRKPELYAAEVFQTLARSHGIVLPRAEVDDGPVRGRIMVERPSAPLLDVLRDMMKWSTNLTAEVVGLTATQMADREAGSLDDSAREMNVWLRDRYGVNRLRFVDHSGLGDGSRAAAVDMVRVLVQAGPSGALRSLMKDIPLRDDNGAPMTGHPVAVQAKTGTLNFASALAGYVTAVGGRDLAFAIFTADMDARARIAPQDRERPDGSREWIGRSRALQLKLLERWGIAYGA